MKIKTFNDAPITVQGKLNFSNDGHILHVLEPSIAKNHRNATLRLKHRDAFTPIEHGEPE